MDAQYTLKAQKAKQGQQRLTLSGNLSLNSLADIKQELLPYIGKKGSLQIALAEVEAIDLGIFQLLQAFVWAQKAHGIEVEILLDLPADQQHLIDISGINIKS